MILSRPDITKELEEGKLRIEPRPLLLAYLNTPIPSGEEYGALKEDRFQFQVTPTGRKR